MKLSLGITPRDYSVAGAVTYDADALAYFTANTAITSSADKNAINTFYLGLKSDGIYTKMKAMYLPLWSSASANKWNLKDPRDLDAAFRLTFTTGWTHSSSGMTPNGTSAYANTFLTPSSVLTINNTHLSFYSRTNRIASEQEIGAGDSRTNFPTLALECCSSSPRYGTYLSYNGGTLNDCSTGNSTNNDGRGFYVGTRTSSNSSKFIKNGSILGTNTNTSLGVQPNYSLYIGAQNYINTVYAPTLKQCSFASIGTGLTDTEATNFYNRVQTLMTYFGINV